MRCIINPMNPEGKRRPFKSKQVAGKAGRKSRDKAGSLTMAVVLTQNNRTHKRPCPFHFLPSYHIYLAYIPPLSSLSHLLNTYMQGLERSLKFPSRHTLYLPSAPTMLVPKISTRKRCRPGSSFNTHYWNKLHEFLPSVI